MKPVVVAIMQNMWVRDPEAVRSAIQRQPTPEWRVKYRRRFIAYALFAGCRTGKVLREVFGDLCNSIIWDEASPNIGSHAASSFPADAVHLRALLLETRPNVILTFGHIAEGGILSVLHDYNFDFQPTVINAPHPCARATGTITRLHTARQKLDIALAKLGGTL